MHIFEDPHYAVKDIKLPVVLGHECAGRVAAVGKSVKGIIPGDRVALEPGVPCGSCEFCMSGRYNLCPDVRFLGARPWLNGAFSRYVSHLRTGQSVLILGAGCIGLMTLEACLARGITNVTMSDLYENRLDMAGTIGARHVVNSSEEDIISRSALITANRGYDVIFETAGSQKTAALTADLVKRGGKIVMVGNVFGETPFNFFKTNSKEADILGVFRYRNLYPAAIELCSEGQAEPKKIVTNYFEFEKIQAAMEYAITQKQEAVKTVIRM